MAEALTNALSRTLAQLLGLEEHPVRIASVVSGAIVKDAGEYMRVFGLILVDKYFENGR